MDLNSHSLSPPNLEWMSYRKETKPSEDDILRTLKSIPLFAELSSRDWRDLAPLFHQRWFQDGEVIFEAGTPGLGMYIIIQGGVRVAAEQMGREVEIARLEPGSFFGEMSLLDEIERSATVLAVGETQLVGIFRPQFHDLTTQRQKLGVVLLRRLAQIVVQRLREADRRLSAIAHPEARKV